MELTGTLADVYTDRRRFHRASHVRDERVTQQRVFQMAVLTDGH